MFRLSQSEIVPKQEILRLQNDKAGAYVEFEGKVRNHSNAKNVRFLEYEVFDELAQKEADQIILEAKQQFHVLDIACIHRYGQLQIGEIAVWIGVSAAHRDAAFKACRFMIDELKHRLPIWKKEHYEMEDKAEWIQCHETHSSAATNFHASEYYARQRSVSFVGESGQNKLRSSKVLVVGAGGLGCPALTQLVTAGVGNITICDGDTIEVSNLHRQTLFHYDDVGKPKAPTTKQRLLSVNPSVHIEVIQRFVEQNLIPEIMDRGYDIVLDCTDRFEAKYMLHDICYKNGIPLVTASVYQLEGQLNLFYSKNKTSGCMRCLWPSSSALDCIGNCTDAGVLGVVPSILGNFQALEAIKWLLGQPCESESNTVLFSATDLEVSKIQRNKNTECPLCGDGASQSSANDEKETPYEVSVSQLSKAQFQGCELIDIRDPMERAQNNHLETQLRSIPFVDLEKYKTLPKNKSYVLVCQKGVRSKKLTKALRDCGYSNFYSLSYGIGALSHGEPSEARNK